MFSFDVQDNLNNDIGGIADLLFNVDSGQVLYYVVGAGGFLGIGQDYTAVPWNAAFLDEAARAIRLTVEQQTFNAAPTLNPDNLPQEAGTNWDAAISNYWDGLMQQGANPENLQPVQSQ